MTGNGLVASIRRANLPIGGFQRQARIFRNALCCRQLAILPGSIPKRRRQLTPGQKALVAERLATLKRGGDRKSQKIKTPIGALITSKQSIKQIGKQPRLVTPQNRSSAIRQTNRQLPTWPKGDQNAGKTITPAGPIVSAADHRSYTAGGLNQAPQSSALGFENAQGNLPLRDVPQPGTSANALSNLLLAFFFFTGGRD